MKHEIRQPDGTATVDLTPGRAIRYRCLECVGFNTAEVRDCGGDELLKDDTTVTCPLYRYRLGKGRPSVRTIRKECLYCMCGSSKAVEDCPSILCALWPYRRGHNPERKGQGDAARFHGTDSARKSPKGRLDAVASSQKATK